MSLINPESINRIINILAWTVGALFAACLIPFLGVIVGFFDPSYGVTGSLLIYFALCCVMVLAGMFGYAVVASLQNNASRAVQDNIICGAIFSVITLGLLFFVSSFFSLRSYFAIVLIPIAVGVLSFFFVNYLNKSSKLE